MSVIWLSQSLDHSTWSCRRPGQKGGFKAIDSLLEALEMWRIGLQPYLLLTSSSVPMHQSSLLLKAISYRTRKDVVTGQVRKLEALVHCVF